MILVMDLFIRLRKSDRMTNKNFWDFSAGIFGYSSQYYGGIAVNHLTEPEEFYIKQLTEVNLPMKITAHVGAIIPIAGSRDGSTYISPNFIYQKQRDFNQYNIGFYISKAPLVGGIWYRGGDAFILLSRTSARNIQIWI